MEIQGKDGSKTHLNSNSTTIFGRQNLSNIKDLSISRRHISFDPISSSNSPTNQTSPRVSFEVLGKNPIWIYTKEGDKKVTTLKRYQRGELGIDDLFCVSGKNLVWFTLKRVEDEVLGNEVGERLKLGGRFSDELSESLEGNYGVDGNYDLGLDFVDVSNIDPVQEFGFLVIGHEFDQYPKKMIREIKNWDWFLNDPIGGSDDDDDESEETKVKKTRSRKRKKTSGDDDVEQEWTAESEGEELATNTTMVRRPKYRTRSKDPGISHNKRGNKGTSSKASSNEEEEEYEVEDEEDQTLGGFIVNDENLEEEEEGNEIEDDDEEEFVEDEYDELEE